MQDIFIKNTTLVTGYNPGEILENANVHILGSSVSSITTGPQIVPPGAEVVNGTGKITLPGLINAHSHFYSAFARGLFFLPVSHNFKQILENLWWKLDRKLTQKACYYSALLGSIEAIKSGTTAVFDHHAAPMCMGLKHISKATEEAGIRACLCYEVSDRDGKEIAQRGIEENKNFIQGLMARPSQLTKGLFGLHASFTLEDETLQQCIETANAVNSGLHIHLAEDLLDQEECQSRYGCRVVERLARLGALNSKTLAAHAVHLDEGELDLIRSSDCFLVHNPQSNMNNGVGVAPIETWQASGIRFGLGTDAMTYNMLEELRSAVWLQNLEKRDPSTGFSLATHALFKGNSQLAESVWGLPLGQIQTGGPADLVMFNYQPFTPFTRESLLGHIVFGISQSSVDTTIVNGRILLRHGALTFLNEAEIVHEAKIQAEQLWQKLKE